jgi:hypothetical protein
MGDRDRLERLIGIAGMLNQWGPRKKHDKLGIPSIIANFDHPLDVILAARPEVA